MEFIDINVNLDITRKRNSIPQYLIVFDRVLKGFLPVTCYRRWNRMRTNRVKQRQTRHIFTTVTTSYHTAFLIYNSL